MIMGGVRMTSRRPSPLPRTTWPHPEPGVYSTDVVARWILGRRGIDPSLITLSADPDHLSRHRWTLARGYLHACGARPMDAAVRPGMPAAILLDAVRFGDGIAIHPAIAHRGALLPPQVVVKDAQLPDTLIAAVAGHRLGRLLAHPELGALADAVVASVHCHRASGSLQVHLEPGRIVHACMMPPGPEKDDR